MSIGHIFFDNNTIQYIRENRLVGRVLSNARAAHLDILATELNLVEAYSASPDVADRIVDTIGELTGGADVLPWTGALLKAVGEGFVSGAEPIQIDRVSLEVVRTEDGRAALRRDLKAFKDRIDATHRDLHARNRQKLQKMLLERGVRARWEELPAFLEEWRTLDTRRQFALASWRDCEIAAPFPEPILDGNHTWMLASDADALGLFQGALVFEQPRQVQRMDQLQLPYLGGSDRRILVTRDVPFATAAGMVVHGRYSLARVMTLSEYFG